MDWVEAIFGGYSNQQISEGQYHGRNEEEGISYGPSSHYDGLSNVENEDMSHAIALPFSEEQQSTSYIADYSFHLDEEQLARALQESLTIEYPYEIDHPHVPSPFPVSMGGYGICAGCNSHVGLDRYLNCMDAVWHPECFRCHACNLPIFDHELSVFRNHPYHKSCCEEHDFPKCDVCKHFIPTNAYGIIEYKAHPFWQQKYCPLHEFDGTHRCCSCERMQPRDVNYVSLDDGRLLCLECSDSAIMETDEIRPLHFDIQDFYEGLNMKVEQTIPLLLVERQALNEAFAGEKKVHHHIPETRGLCLSEEQTVRKISRRTKIGVGNRIMKMMTEPYKFVRTCEVTAILILYGLPRLLTGSILAHEMMHAWLRLRGYGSLGDEIEEGICQVLAHMWLEAETVSGSGSDVASTSASSSVLSPTIKKGTRSQTEKKLGDFFKHQIESDSSHAYGDGFRAANKAVLQYGLRQTLDHIKLTGSLPS